MKTNSRVLACGIEPLEARIAPASLFVTYIDADGDVVKITATKAGSFVAPLTEGNLERNANGQLQKLTLDAGFALTDITFTVTKKPGGDGLADVGAIYATGFDIGNVTVKGDLGHIEAGNGDPEFPALKTLSVRSLGRYGAITQTGVPDFQSDFNGSLFALKVTGDIKDAYVRVGGGGNLGSAMVGGSIVGENGFKSGIYAEGDLGPVVVKGDVIGGDASFSGSIGAGKAVKSITIGGSVSGGEGANSGSLFSAFVTVGSGIGTVKIGHDLRGGSGTHSGEVDADGAIAISVGGSLIGGSGVNSGIIDTNSGATGKISIGGSVIAGSASFTGLISTGSVPGGVKIGGSLVGGFVNVPAGQNISRVGSLEIGGDSGPIAIGGDVIGGRLRGDGSLIASGEIQAARMASLTIGGSLIAGHNDGNGDLSQSGLVLSASIGSVKIKGSLIGNDTLVAAIVAFGKAADEPGFAIGSVTIGGRMDHAAIQATGSSPARPNLTIGPVKVAGDWIASSLLSGAVANNAFYGDGDDTLQAGYTSRIASVAIGGIILGTSAGGDHFGFVAHEIGTFKAGGKTIARTTGTIDPPVNVAYATSDVTVREI